jgi:hypothetical protein
MDPEDEVPMLVFEGTDEDAVFLVSLLESGGITATNRTRSARFQPACVYVRACNSADARDVVADFKARCGPLRSPEWWLQRE